MLRRLFRHLGLKVLSVVLALVLWVSVAGQKHAERALRVPVEFQNIPESLELIGDTLAFADVRVRGAASALSQLRAADLVVLVNLSTARPGRRMFHLTPEQVAAPTGVRVQHVVPATVSLTFETSITKSVPVVAAVEGDPAPGYVVGKIAAAPPEVQVVGPESVVKRVTRATTEPVNLNGATARVRDSVTIGLSEDAARLLVPRSATVTVDILPAPIERVLTGVPIAVRGASKGMRVLLTPRQVSVTARGPGNLVRNLSPQAVPAWIDVSGLERGRYNLPVHFDSPEDYTVTDVQPRHLSVRIQ
jgi:YbbR domain-containing protein